MLNQLSPLISHLLICSVFLILFLQAILHHCHLFKTFPSEGVKLTWAGCQMQVGADHGSSQDTTSHAGRCSNLEVLILRFEFLEIHFIFIFSVRALGCTYTAGVTPLCGNWHYINTYVPVYEGTSTCMQAAICWYSMEIMSNYWDVLLMELDYQTNKKMTADLK